LHVRVQDKRYDDRRRLEHVSEQPAPRITVTLPGGRTLDGHLHARRQRPDGTWWYEVTVEVPAGAVQPVDGEDYDQVPTEKADTRRWVLEALRHDTPDKRALVLHEAGCFAAVGRLTEADSKQAAIFLREGWATGCGVCKPEPGAGGAGASS
jgi:hypothetical protein